MLYAQLSQALDLRSLEAGFNSHESQHFHLGTHRIKHSTLAEANKTRPDAVFNDTVMQLMGQVSGQLRRDELMHLLDSTSITLKGREFAPPCALSNRKPCTQGIKVHVLLDGQTHTPQWHSFSAANVNNHCRQ